MKSSFGQADPRSIDFGGSSTPSPTNHAGMIEAFIRDPGIFGSAETQRTPSLRSPTHDLKIPLDVRLERDLFAGPRQEHDSSRRPR